MHPVVVGHRHHDVDGAVRAEHRGRHVRHPHLLAGIDAFDLTEPPFAGCVVFVLELAEEDLSHRVARAGALPPAEVAAIGAQVADGLVQPERMRRELELAAEIQRSLLPEAPDDGFALHGVNIPAGAISGDFYDFFPLPDGRICFNLGDVFHPACADGDDAEVAAKLRRLLADEG